ncbi:class I SAM-dependent methyltransferase [Candidatus Uhrbacteria bacterium]|nr:class I SAM-dependent methyltransferase [Candidatus Uhrbacteria bacterium]
MRMKKFRRVKKGWEPVADWYVGYMGKEGGAFQRDIVFPGAERLLRLKKGGTYLDIACGQGAFAKRLAKDGSRTIHGFDISPSLITEAKKDAPKNAHFRVADATGFATHYPPSSFDGAACNLAIQNIDPMEPVFADAARVLKPGAAFVLTMNHPAFRQPRQSGWGWDEERKLQYRRVDKYMEPYEMPILAHPGSAPSVKTYSYHRPLSVFVTALAKHGFVVDAMEEWVSNKVSDSGPKAKAENVARKEIPMFLAIRARKM